MSLYRRLERLEATIPDPSAPGPPSDLSWLPPDLRPRYDAINKALGEAGGLTPVILGDIEALERELIERSEV